jgi:Transposase
MTETIIEEWAASRHDQWRERVAGQERSGLSVKQYCKEHGLTECSFYAWRKRLRKAEEPVRFALVEREAAAREESAGEARLELVLASGERLRIGAGVDSTTLRTVLQALRA